MTCGVCNPEAFRTGGKVYGYFTLPSDLASYTGNAPANLHFIGCEFVFMDQAQGNVCNRKGVKRAMKVMRPGDRLVIDRATSLGTKPDRQAANIARIEAGGIEVLFLTDECEVLRHAA